jgi:hypothetical protein
MAKRRVCSIPRAKGDSTQPYPCCVSNFETNCARYGSLVFGVLGWESRQQGPNSLFEAKCIKPGKQTDMVPWYHIPMYQTLWADQALLGYVTVSALRERGWRCSRFGKHSAINLW